MSMKKILLAALVLGFAAVGVSGCAKEEPPAQKESAPGVEVPVKIASMGVTVKPDAVPQSTQEEMAGLVEHPVAGSVTSAVQSSTQTLVRKRGTIVGGVTASAQSSTQALARKKDAIVGGVTTAAQSSSQAIAQKEGTLAEKVA